MQYILYKNAVQLDTLAVVQYLHSLGVSAVPRAIVEREHPPEVLRLPALRDTETDQVHCGLEACVAFFESRTGLRGLLAAALEFKARRPEYRIGSEARVLHPSNRPPGAAPAPA